MKGGREILKIQQTLKMEEGDRGIKECGWSLEVEKGKKMNSSTEPPEGTQSCNALILELLTSRTVR